MPKNGFVMRFFGGAQLPVGVVGVQRSIQLSYDRTCMRGLETVWQNVPGAGKLYYSKGQSKKQSKFDETGWQGIKQLRLVQNCEKIGIRRRGKVTGPNRRFRK